MEPDTSYQWEDDSAESDNPDSNFGAVVVGGDTLTRARLEKEQAKQEKLKRKQEKKRKHEKSKEEDRFMKSEIKAARGRREIVYTDVNAVETTLDSKIKPYEDETHDFHMTVFGLSRDLRVNLQWIPRTIAKYGNDGVFRDKEGYRALITASEQLIPSWYRVEKISIGFFNGHEVVLTPTKAVSAMFQHRPRSVTVYVKKTAGGKSNHLVHLRRSR